MPGDGFSFAVFVRSKPYFIHFSYPVSEFFDYFFLVRGYHIAGVKIIVDFYGALSFFEVTDVAKAGFHGKIFTEEFFDGFSFCGRFYYQ